MPSFWPFGRDDNSAASFEKILSQLSTKINAASAQNDRLRQNQRRLKALWTLYASFAYILVALILVLVTRFENWNAYEYTAVASGPVVIYAVRTALDAYYNFRLSRSNEHLNDLSKQREESIEKLKKATRYNSTQQLLDKYGGSPGQASGGGKGKRQPSPQPKKGARRSDGAPPQQGPRTTFMPPPTANIPGRPPPPGPQIPNEAAMRPPGAPPPDSMLAPNAPGEEFAPNAFSQPPPPAMRQPQSSQYAAPEGPAWYDRILDVVLGEDETSAKNRIVLICQECRLVNGQAPPGARTLEEVGRWRCSSCQAWNGVESMEKKILKDAGIASPTSAVAESPEEAQMVDEEVGSEDAAEEDVKEEMEETPPASSTRSKARQRKKA